MAFNFFPSVHKGSGVVEELHRSEKRKSYADHPVCTRGTKKEKQTIFIRCKDDLFS